MTIMTDQRDRPLHATIAVVLAIATAGYLAPWAIAAVRGRSNVWAVFWVNLLTGWTVLGWCIAPYMSLTSHRRLRPWGPRGL
ncbi:superinfection immunity protein [Micrococcus luteus]|uniref:superinfection immunity protein n=1 Tax=Micrococcus luteus TaxID=1270 RepID=UPI00128E17EA|nr:superinfection immunity protein [Micrococcus luteus]